MPLVPNVLFNADCDLAVALVFFAFDNDAVVSTASACPFSSISRALRFLATVAVAADIFAPLSRTSLWHLLIGKMKQKKDVRIQLTVRQQQQRDKINTSIYTQKFHFKFKVKQNASTLFFSSIFFFISSV